MISCRRTKELLAQREAGLSEADALTLELHLSECESCRAQAQALDSLGELYREGGQGLSDRARRRALEGALANAQPTEEATSSERRRVWLMPALAAAAAVAVGLTWFASSDGARAPVASAPAPQSQTKAPAKKPAPVAANSAVGTDRVLEGDIRLNGRPLAPGVRLSGIGLSSATGDGDKVAGIGLSTVTDDESEKVAGIGLSTVTDDESEKVAGIGLSTVTDDEAEKVAGIGLSTVTDEEAEKVAGIGLSTVTDDEGEKVAGIGLSTVEGGSVALANATVVLRPKTSVVWRPAQRVLALREGAVLTSVDGPAEAFRVATRQFVVEVLGTEFEVDAQSVSVKDGTVRVLDAQGVEELAVVKAGARWQMEDADADAASDSNAGAADAAPPVLRATDVAAALDRARGQLAAGNAKAARRQLRRLLGNELGRRQRAEAETLVAECALVDGNLAEAARRYRAVAGRYSDLAAGETALFAAARTFANAGDATRARALYQRYARKYPRGRFIVQVRQRLATFE